MSNFSIEYTLNGQAYADEHLQRIKYERALHVLHELKELEIPELADYSSQDLNWLEPDAAMTLLENVHAQLGADKTLDIMKETFEDSVKRWLAFNERPIVEQGCWLGVTEMKVRGLSFPEVQKGLAIAHLGDTPYKIMPEHYGVKGTITEGQMIMEVFGCFGEPVQTKGIADNNIPAYTGAVRHEDYPLITAGEIALARTGENIHVGAIHEMKPVEDGVDIISTFFCPKDAPKAIADGHAIHFALEFGEGFKLIAKEQGLL